MIKGIDLGRLLAKSLTLAALAGFIGLTPGALAIDQADDVGVFGSVTVARSARDAAKAMKSGDYVTATNLYRQAISSKGDFIDFYYGLLYSAIKAGQWDQAMAALDGLAEKDPSSKGHLDYETGHCLRMLNRFDEAIPHLRAGLTKANADSGFLVSKVKDLQIQTAKKAETLVPGMIDANGNVVPEPPKDIIVKAPEKRAAITAEMLNPDATDTGRDYENAFRQSEWIGICKYKGYEKKENIGFFNPPTANFVRIKCLKGPPLNPQMPIKFKFYDHAGVKPPEGWKFGPDKMPKVDSEWLIFIPNAVPIPGFGFDTFKGDYGRQEANEKNLGEIYAIIEAHHGQI